ncbi:hypothetical protein ROZALSC1DRAFT_25088, partial [Rozella allomycis CSF55]
GYDQAASALSVEYRDYFGNVDYIISEIRNCRQLMQKYDSVYCSRYAAFNLPTMCGKTKTMLEVGKREYVIMLKLKSEDPPQGPKELAGFMKQGSSTDDFLLRHASWTLGVIEWFTKTVRKADKSIMTPKEWLTFHIKMDQEEFSKLWGPVYKRITTIYEKMKETALENWNSRVTLDRLNEYLLPVMEAIDTLPLIDKTPLILCIDEAGVMLDEKNDNLCFRVWRRLMTISCLKNTFGVILDTTRVLSNFTPSLENDPTLRTFAIGNKLHKPVIYLGCFDLFHVMDLELDLQSICKRTIYYLHLFMLGRPYWGASAMKINGLVNESKANAHMLLTISLAKAKLTCNRDIFLQQFESQSESAKASVLSHLVYLDFDRSSQLAQEMASSSSSEPVVSEAALGFLIDKNDQISVYETAQSLTTQEVVRDEKKGEFVFQLWFLDSLLEVTRDDKCKRDITIQVNLPMFGGDSVDLKWTKSNEFNTRPFLFKDLLSKMVSGEAFESILKSLDEDFADGIVLVSHIVKLFQNVSRELIVDAFLRGCGFAMKQNEAAVDFAIPVLLKTNGKYILTENNMSLFMIQVKNEVRSYQKKAATVVIQKWAETFKLKKYLSFYINFNPEFIGRPFDVSKTNEKCQATFVGYSHLKFSGDKIKSTIVNIAGRNNRILPFIQNSRDYSIVTSNCPISCDGISSFRHDNSHYANIKTKHFRLPKHNGVISAQTSRRQIRSWLDLNHPQDETFRELINKNLEFFNRNELNAIYHELAGNVSHLLKGSH